MLFARNGNPYAGAVILKIANIICDLRAAEQDMNAPSLLGFCREDAAIPTAHQAPRAEACAWT